MMRYLLICLLFGLPISLYAQRENSFWPLGHPIAVDFAGNTPKLVPVPVTYFFGGGAGICDANGEVLFYTNGMAFFTKDHQVMPGTENFSDHRAATYYNWYMYNGADSLDYVSINNFFNTDIKVVQLNKAIPRYHVFYLMYPTRELLFNGGMIYVDNYKTELPKLVYSIIDMSLSNGKGGIDPNYKDVVVADNVTRHFDIMSDGQCGVWIVVNKFNQIAKPQLQTQGHSQLQSYLLQPSGNIMLVHSQAEFYLPQDFGPNYPIQFYQPPIIRFLGNGKYLSTQYELDNSANNFGTFYGLYFNKVLFRSFDSKTGSMIPIVDTFVNIGDTSGLVGTYHEHDIYITDNQQYIYTIGYDNLYSYDAQLIGNPIALQQSRTTFDLVSYMQQYYNYPNTAYSFIQNTRFRKGPDNMLYFIFNMHNAAYGPIISNNVKTILARIPNLDAPISANNIEIVDTANTLQQFENFANYIQNHPNEIKLRGGPKTHLVASSSPGSYIQTGTNAIIYEPSTVPKLLIDTIICEGKVIMCMRLIRNMITTGSLLIAPAIAC